MILLHEKTFLSRDLHDAVCQQKWAYIQSGLHVLYVIRLSMCSSKLKCISHSVLRNQFAASIIIDFLGAKPTQLHLQTPLTVEVCFIIRKLVITCTPWCMTVVSLNPGGGGGMKSNFCSSHRAASVIWISCLYKYMYYTIGVLSRRDSMFFLLKWHHLQRFVFCGKYCINSQLECS